MVDTELLEEKLLTYADSIISKYGSQGFRDFNLARYRAVKAAKNYQNRIIP